MEFKVKYDPYVKGISIFTLICLFVVWLLTHFIFLLVLPIIFLFFFPYKYILTENCFVIKKLLFPKRIRFDNITKIDRVPKGGMDYAFRLLGSGGFLGFFGYSWSKNFGWYRMNSGSMDNLILIQTTTGNKYVISCSDDLFSELQKRVKANPSAL